MASDMTPVCPLTRSIFSPRRMLDNHTEPESGRVAWRLVHPTLSKHLLRRQRGDAGQAGEVAAVIGADRVDAVGAHLGDQEEIEDTAAGWPASGDELAERRQGARSALQHR